jgi:uncharacterized protein (DUF2141 family)
MKRLLVISFAFMIISDYSFSQYNLNIRIIDIKNNTGGIMLQLFDENENVLIQEKGIIKDKKCTLLFKNLKPGKYAVRYFHDENLNGVMETNMAGKPKEGYGFSNNVTGMFGPPPFKKWLFGISADKEIVLKPLY